jgi:uncharacterized SAM-binding protein YcdF (DUF218 family)
MLILVGYGVLILGDRLIVDQPPHTVDVIVVLGAPVEADGTVGPTLKARVDTAAALFHAGYASALICTGANVQNAYVEASVMAAYARDLGIPSSAIVVEPHARTTTENARYSVALMNQRTWRSAIVVTSPYHTARARYAFVKHGIDVITVASDPLSRVSWPQRLTAILYESVSWLDTRFTE